MPHRTSDGWLSLCRRFRLVRTSLSATILFACSLSTGAAEPSAQPAKEPDHQVDAMWTDQIEPILSKNCFRCHGSEKQKGGLDLRSIESMLVGGVDGSVVIPGRPGESSLFQRIQPDSKDRMPPENEPQLSAAEITLINQWIARVPPPSHPTIGSGQGVDWSGNAPTLMELASRTKWSPPEGMPATDAIDHLIEAGWQAQRVSGSGLCDDRVFVRRIYLDLMGRIPTVAENDAFVNSADAGKRANLVDQLLSRDEFPQHMAEFLDVMLLDRKGKATEAERKSQGWFAYLERAIATNRPWNELVSELIIARPSSPESKGAVRFLYEQKNNHQQMAEAIAPVAFGVSIGCAQCHDHPLAHEIKQQDYWGLVAAFNRTINADTNDGPALSESAIGGFVSFTNLKKQSQSARLTLLNGKTIDEARPAEGVKEEDSDENYVVPPVQEASKENEREKGKGKGRGRKNLRHAAIPKFSRRQAVAAAISRENPLLARAFVNRIWEKLLGRGIVSPAGELDSRHPPSHPELLAWLSQDFEQSGYNVKQLVRTIALSRTYQLKPRGAGQTSAAPELFAYCLEKPLSAEVLHRSLLIATGSQAPESDELRQALIATFPDYTAVDYNATLQQAAFLTNSPLVDRLLKPTGKNLTARLLELPTHEARVHDLFLNALGRAPDTVELAEAVAYLQERQARLEAATGHLVWAVLASPEFLLNH